MNLTNKDISFLALFMDALIGIDNGDKIDELEKLAKSFKKIENEMAKSLGEGLFWAVINRRNSRKGIKR
jgi:hypothetical protein